jgi:HD superfamily phosphohydrolase
MPDRESPFNFQANEPLPGNDDYVVVHRDLGIDEGRARWVACGGAGVVYRTAYKQRMERAVKILAPEDASDGATASAYERTFRNEIAVLSQITHTRVAKIMDFGPLVYEDREYQWYAMEYIDGQRFDRVLLDEEISPEQFLELIDQILDGLEWLHRNDVMHCDVKEENVLVRRYGNDWSATLVDLGVAKSLKPAVEEARLEPVEIGVQPEEDRTSFFSSKKITREAWRDRLNRDLPLATIREMFPGQDLHAVGRLIGLGLDEAGPLRPRLRAAVGAPGLRALETVISRLRSEDPKGDDYYKSVAEVRRDWRKLGPSYLAPMNVPELAVGSSAVTSIATPTGRVSLTERLVDVVNHPLVQRLRHIPQLELMPLVYPGAGHTRLLHALSTFDMCRRYIGHLLNDPAFRLMAEKRDIEAALLWALLHDVGHYPLSHMFEDAAEAEQMAGGARTIPTDDDLFWAFVDPASARSSPAFSTYPDAIASALAASTPPATLLLGELLESRFGGDITSALHDLDDAASQAQTVLRAVLSSEVDVDKVSYLTDDSLMSGVRYGLGMDLDALLGALRAPYPEHVEIGRPRLALSDKGLTAAEAVVLSRYWMLRRVYWHHTNRATIAMVKFVVDELLRSGRFDMEKYFSDTLFMDAPAALGYLSAAMDTASADGAFSDGERVNPLRGLLGGNRQIYKRLATVARSDEGDAERAIYDLLGSGDQEARRQLVEACREAVGRIAGRPLLDGEIVLDIPTKRREELGAGVVVYLQRTPDEPRTLDEASPVVGGLKSEFDLHVRKSRVLLHPRLAEELGEPDLERCRRAVWDALAERAAWP